MKVTIITVCFNSDKTILDTILSVKQQSYKDIEYIIIDGDSTDNTNQIIHDNISSISQYISENDNGLYDAINKGLALASGDIIGVLNSDDVLSSDNTIQLIVDSFSGVSAVFGDVNFYRGDKFQSIKRHYSSSGFTKYKFSRGIMPAHPSFYVLRQCYLDAGFYNTDYKIAADFDMLLRIFSLPNFTFKYINTEIVKMRLGGVSTSGFKSNILLNQEIMESCKKNGIQTNWCYILSKYPKKILGLLFK